MLKTSAKALIKKHTGKKYMQWASRSHTEPIRDNNCSR